MSRRRSAPRSLPRLVATNPLVEHEAAACPAAPRSLPRLVNAAFRPSQARIARAIAGAALGVLTVSAAWAPATYAADNVAAQVVRAFEVPAGPLGGALTAFAAQAGVSVTATPALVQGLRSGGVRGSLDIAEALSRLLAGTGLEAVRQGPGVFVLRRLPAGAAAPQAATLAEVRVSATVERDGTSEGTGAYTTGVTTAATGLALSMRETPQTISVVTRAQIEDQALDKLPAVLRQVPGVSYEQHDSERYSLYARGFEIGNFLLDGLPISSYPSGSYGLLYQSQMDMVAFDRVEIVKGATGLMRGAGLPSAAVNMIRKRPTPGFQATAQATLGSWNLRRLEGDVSGPLNAAGSLRARLAAAGEEKDAFIDRYGRRSTAAFGAVEADLSPDTLLSVSASYLKNDITGVPFGGAVPMFYSDGGRIDLPRSWSQVPEWSSWNAETTILGADLEHRFASGWLARLSYSHQRSDSRLRGVVWEGYVDRDGGGAFAWRDENTDDRRRDAWRFDLSGPFAWLGRQHRAMFGLSRVDSRSEGDNYYDWFGHAPADFFAEAAGLPRLTRAQRVWFDSEASRVRETSGYGAARLRATDRLALIVGARVSDWSTDREITDRTATPNASTTLKYRHRNVASPYLGAVLDLDANYSAYASYTDIFTPQSYRDGKGDLLGPVDGEAYEAGIKGEFFDGKLNATLAVFRVKQDNLGEDTGAMLNGQPVYVGIDGAVATGVEAEIAGEIRPGWQVNAGIGRHRVRDAAGREVLTVSARSSFKLFTTYRLPGEWNRLTVGGGMRWQSRTYKDKVGPDNDGIAGTADDRLAQGAYAVVDLMAGYRLTPKVSLTVNVNNLFDKKYLAAFRQGSQYGSPRYVGAGLRVRF